MSVMAGLGKLQQSLKSLSQKWEQTRLTWNDKVRKDFEDEHVKPLLDTAVSTVAAMERLGRILDQATKECSQW